MYIIRFFLNFASSIQRNHIKEGSLRIKTTSLKLAPPPRDKCDVRRDKKETNHIFTYLINLISNLSWLWGISAFMALDLQ